MNLARDRVNDRPLTFCFKEAKLLWNDDKMIEIKTSYEDEERFINIGKISTKVYAVVTTYRAENI